MAEHVVQNERDYCVPACVVMVEIWRGQVPVDPWARQRELYETYRGPQGLCPLQGLHGSVGRHLPWFDVDDPDTIEVFAAMIDDGSWAIVSCLPGPFGQVLRDRGLESPHGDLPAGPLPYHALCVTGRTNRTLHVLDPWSFGDQQPLALSFEAFVPVWTGHVLLAPPQPR